MILAYTIEAMRPYVEAGIAQANGADTGDARTKRGTLRRINGPNSPYWLLIRNPRKYRLQHWWGSPRGGRGEPLGETACRSAVRLTVRRGPVIPDWHGGLLMAWRWTGGGAQMKRGPAMLCDLLPRPLHRRTRAFARADGFDSVEALADFLLPEPGEADFAWIRW